MLAGASPEQRKEFILEDPKTYSFLSHGSLPVAGVDDVAEFQQTCKSMFIMGLNQEDLSPLFRIVSATLLFGNMKFKQDRNSDQATLPDNTVAQKIAHLLGLSVTDMTKAFLKPRIKVGRDYVTKAQTKEQVRISLDSKHNDDFVLISSIIDDRLSSPWKQFLRPATNACSVGW